MNNLDGKDQIKPVPFDAHEQVVRVPHTHSNKKGYEPAEYEHSEYPKHVGDVVVSNEDEEKAALAAQAEVAEPEVEEADEPETPVNPETPAPTE